MSPEILILTPFILVAGYVLAQSLSELICESWTELLGYYQNANSYSNLQRFVLILMAPLMVFFFFIVSVLIPGALLYAALETKYFWYSLPGLFGCWFFFNRQRGIPKNIADWLKPLLIGMGVIGAMTLMANLWIPKAQWIWLFRIESTAYDVNQMLDVVLPKALWVRLTILLGIMTTSLMFPFLGKWSTRFDKTLATAKNVSGVLAIFISMTVFGEGQSGKIGESVANEKYKREEVDLTAISQLIVTARLKENSQAETQATVQWLDSIHEGVVAELNVPPSLEENDQLRKKGVRYLIETRVKELREAIQNQPQIRHVGKIFDTQLADILGRSLTEQDRNVAKISFEKALNYFVSDVAKISGHPIIELLSSANAPELVQDLVKDLYKEEVINISKVVTDPLTDALFRPESPEAKVSLSKALVIVQRPVFNPQILPRNIVHPTVADKIHRQLEQKRVEDVIKEAKRR